MGAVGTGAVAGAGSGEGSNIGSGDGMGAGAVVSDDGEDIEEGGGVCRCSGQRSSRCLMSVGLNDDSFVRYCSSSSYCRRNDFAI
jgi:hypothetical protein